jgi:uncharacterized protein (DUF305 family)
MTTKTTFVAIAAAVFGALTTASVQSIAQHQMHAGGAKGESPTMQMHRIMMEPMKNMKMSGDTDRDFAMMMAEHHMSGIRMAQVELKSGKNAELKRIARNIVDSQTKERAILLKHVTMKH